MTGRTRILGLIADPVAGARSPGMANTVLAEHGCRSLTIVNRTPPKAAAVTARVKEAFPLVEVRATDTRDACYEIAVNVTSLGMKPDDELPLSAAQLAQSTLVADCVVAPERTRLLEVAEKNGHPIHTGVPMLASQLDLMCHFMGVEP